MSKLIIGKPKIKKHEQCYRLISTLKYDENKTYDMWFEVEEEYGKYLCSENADAFIIALLPYFVKHECDVEIDGYLSSRIYYQLTSYLIPLLCEAFNKKMVSIICKVKDEEFNPTGVGASISCGVDSFYTLLKHTNQKDSSYNITHLTYFNAGSHGQFGGDEARKLFKKRLKRIKSFCEENLYALVTVDSNMNEFIMMNHENTNTFRTLACVLALQKLFNIYYFASCCSFNGSHIAAIDTTYYDILNVQCLSNNNARFYCSGMEVNRQQKIEYISDKPITYKWLDVCVEDDCNCGKCEKCIRTMTALESIGKLQNYKDVFDIEEFNKNKFKYYIKIYKYNRNKMKHEFYDEIIKSYKKHGHPLPKLAYLLSFYPEKNAIKYNIKKFVKMILPKKIVNKIQNYRMKKGIIFNDGWYD